MKLYSIGEAAKCLKVSYSRLNRVLAEDREKETRRVGGQRVLSAAELPEIAKLLAERKGRDRKTWGKS